jgi:hypothetical protein
MVQTQITEEVRELIEDRLDAGMAIQAAWITEAVLSQHPRIKGPDKDFYLFCAQKAVRQTVRSVTRDYDLREETAQLRLEGCEYVQKAYLIDREGEAFIVPIAQCTYAELTGKIAEYRNMANGCSRHADELEGYRDSILKAA